MKPFGRLQLLLDYLQKNVPAKLLEVHLAKYRFQLDPDTQKLMVPPSFDQKLEVEVIEKLKLSISTYFGPGFWLAVIQKVEKQQREQENK